MTASLSTASWLKFLIRAALAASRPPDEDEDAGAPPPPAPTLGDEPDSAFACLLQNGGSADPANPRSFLSRFGRGPASVVLGLYTDCRWKEAKDPYLLNDPAAAASAAAAPPAPPGGVPRFRWRVVVPPPPGSVSSQLRLGASLCAGGSSFLFRGGAGLGAGVEAVPFAVSSAGGKACQYLNSRARSRGFDGRVYGMGVGSDPNYVGKPTAGPGGEQRTTANLFLREDFFDNTADAAAGEGGEDFEPALGLGEAGGGGLRLAEKEGKEVGEEEEPAFLVVETINKFIVNKTQRSLYCTPVSPPPPPFHFNNPACPLPCCRSLLGAKGRRGFGGRRQRRGRATGLLGPARRRRP